MVLSFIGEIKGEDLPEFGELVQSLSPPRTRFFTFVTALASILAVFGALTVYWILMANFLFNTGNVIWGERERESSYRARLLRATTRRGAAGARKSKDFS